MHNSLNFWVFPETPKVQFQKPRQERKVLYTLGIINFPIPGEPGFLLNTVYAKPEKKQEDKVMRAYS